MNRFRHHENEDSGAIAVLFALSLVVLIGLAALAVDVGYWYASKRQLQTAADAAALAGAQDLAKGKTNAEIWASADDYAHRNFNTPLASARCSVVPPSPGGYSDIGDDFVKVTVSTNASAFLSRVLNRGSTLIQAQSIARVGWLAGAVGPVPWGLSIVRIASLTGDLGSSHTTFVKDADGYWTGTFAPGAYGGLTLHVTNGQDYTEDISGLAAVATLPSTGRITAIDTDRTTFTGGGTARVMVTLATPLATGGKIEASTGGPKTSLALVAGTTSTYAGNVAIAETTDAFAARTIDIVVTEGKSTQSASITVFARRANYILQEVEVHPAAVRATDSATVRVKPLDFTYGTEYQLKVEGGTGTTGNYQALDFASLDHSVCGYPGADPTHSGGANYQDNIAGVTQIPVHIGDFITTLPGDKVGPTKSGIDDRLAGETVRTFAEWEAAGKPDTKQLCVIPICEKTTDPGGRDVLQVVSFATFYLDHTTVVGGKTAVIGYFVEWTEAGLIVVDTPPDELAVKAVHLSAEGLDF